MHEDQIQDKQTLRSIALTVGALFLGTIAMAVAVNVFAIPL